MESHKERRNRTTVSCLNCHTSKRRCDRKRPCQRCIQLGLAGLCIYEVDSPARPRPHFDSDNAATSGANDDNDGECVDHRLRLRAHIAELEALARALRDAPHAERWAEARRTHERESASKHTANDWAAPYIATLDEWIAHLRAELQDAPGA